MKNEICYTLIGRRIGRFWFGRLVKKVIGNAASVEFDWEWVLRREEEKGDVLGFWHTHPVDLEPSKRDTKTMHAWVDCFDKPLLCILEHGIYRRKGWEVMSIPKFFKVFPANKPVKAKYIPGKIWLGLKVFDVTIFGLFAGIAQRFEK